MEGSYVFNIYSLALIFSSVPAFALAIWIGLKKEKKLINWFSLMLFAAAWWATAYGFELASQDLAQMLFWIKLEYIGICMLPSLWLIFAFDFAGHERWINPFTLTIFGLYSFSTYIAVLTNDYHHLFYANTAIDNSSGPFPLLDISVGPWYVLHTFVFYFMVIWGYISLFLYLGNSKALFKKQNLLIITSTLIPLLVNVGYIFFDLRPYGHIDLTPFAFLATSFIVAMGLLRVGLFDLSPIARAKVINQMDDAFVLLDEQGRISDYNQGLLKLLQREDDEILGIPIDLLLKKKLSTNLSGSSNLLKYKDHVYELSRVPIFQGSKGIGQSILFKDVSDRIKNERRLREQRLELQKTNSLKDRLFSIIAHDLRGPLHNLQEVLALVNSNMLNQEEKESLLGELSRSVDQSVGLMENLLTWAASQQQGETINRVAFNLQELVDEVLLSIHALLEKKNLRVDAELKDLPLVMGDREMIKIVLRNLLGNAIKFSHVGGEIKVKAELNKLVEVKIIDQGVGMSTDLMAKLFSVDLRSRPGTSNEQGSGLGLMLCKDFVEKNGGILKVRSAEGAGSTFSFKLHPSLSDQ